MNVALGCFKKHFFFSRKVLNFLGNYLIWSPEVTQTLYENSQNLE